MQPEDLIRKRAKKIVDAGDVPKAHLQESITLNEKVDALIEEVKKKDLLEYDIQIDEDARLHLKGDKGDTGEKGEKGNDGRDGKDGKNGKDGIDGKDGRDGVDGVDGLDGKDGKDAVLGDIKISDVKELPETIATLQNRTQLLNQMVSSRANSGSGGVFKIVAGTGVTISPPSGLGDVTINATAGGISDGDKGDITVSGGGATWTIDNNTVTNAKLDDMAGHTVKVRVGGSSGDPSDLAMGSHSALVRNGGDIIATDAGNNTVLRRTTGNTLEFGQVDVAQLSATGTPSATTFLRGDNTWATPSGGGGSLTKGIVEVDFGAITTESDIATVSVADATVTTTSYPSVTMYALATTDHDPDDYMVEGLIPYVTNVQNGVGFDVSVRAPNMTFGKYRVTYQF